MNQDKNIDNFDAQQNIEINNENNNQHEGINEEQYKNNNGQDTKPKYKFSDFYKKSSNPQVALITVGLKIASLIIFLFLSVFTSNEAYVMIFVILLNSVDFWYTKNISGRILVGLRWWNSIDPDTQKDTWIFESKNEIKEANIDRNTFWISLYVFTGAWVILCIWELIILNFMWAFFCLISLAISGTNLYGFFRCSKNQQKGAALALKYFAKKFTNNQKK